MAGLFRSPFRGWRLRFLWPFLLLLAAFVIFIEFIVDVGGNAQAPVRIATPLPSPSPASIPLPDRSQLTPAQVVEIIDGDTIDVRLDGDTVRVRYFGSNSPEAAAPCAAAATQRNRELVADKQVYLLSDVRDKDQGGRLLRYVFTSDGRLVDEVLISEGLARAWRPDGTYRDRLVAIENAARAEGNGCLWRR